MNSKMDKNVREQEFMAAVEQHQRLIYKVCYVYATSKDNLNDLYQEVMVNLWKAFPRFRGECKLSTWMYRIGLNTCVSFLRKSRRMPEVVPLSVDIEALADSDASDAAQLRELYQMISRLSQLERALILLWLEEKSYQEMAEIVGISRDNVAVRLNRIREKLKKMSNN
ncbi:MAG: sigma-70 family RNA polymerase sigma factor [Prevotellaceae bacterium]|jgi:RNA polymerase sigma-70 factor (ECF subfamily)|nr:sigma-70 family RNA polymerase sigma factor [Prevotellaceae bacterium]